MDRNAAITVARALIEEMGIQPGELFPEPEATAPAPDIDALLPRRRWVPGYGDEYVWLNSGLETAFAPWVETSLDVWRLDGGNVFPTREAAKEHAANIRAWVELRERSDKVRDGWTVVSDDGNIIPGVGFSSRELRDAAGDHIGRDRIDALALWIWGS